MLDKVKEFETLFNTECIKLEDGYAQFIDSNGEQSAFELVGDSISACIPYYPIGWVTGNTFQEIVDNVKKEYDNFFD